MAFFYTVWNLVLRLLCVCFPTSSCNLSSLTCRVSVCVSQECLKIKTCWACGAFNGVIRKVPGAAALKITHDVQKVMASEAKEAYVSRCDPVESCDARLKPCKYFITACSACMALSA